MTTVLPTTSTHAIPNGNTKNLAYSLEVVEKRGVLGTTKEESIVLQTIADHYQPLTYLGITKSR
jgi:hypothetical protein